MVPVRHAQNTKEPTNHRDIAPKAHAVIPNTMTRRVTALTAHHAQDHRSQDLSASLILATQAKFLLLMVNAKLAHHTKSQRALLIPTANAAESAMKLFAH